MSTEWYVLAFFAFGALCFYIGWGEGAQHTERKFYGKPRGHRDDCRCVECNDYHGTPSEEGE